MVENRVQRHILSAVVIAVIAVCLSLWVQRGSRSQTLSEADTFAERLSTSIATLDKARQVATLESEVARIHREAVDPAIRHVADAQSQYSTLYSQRSWFPSDSEKRTIEAAQANLDRARAQLQRAESQAQAVAVRIKPLYGLVSSHFFAEQRTTIKNSLKVISDVAYQQAWYESLFNAGRAESLTDLIVQFAVSYLGVYIIAYPFAWLYFVFWSGPWIVYSYCASAADFPLAAAMWALWAVIMALPFIVLICGVLFVQRYKERVNRRRDQYQFQ